MDHRARCSGGHRLDTTCPEADGAMQFGAAFTSSSVAESEEGGWQPQHHMDEASMSAP